MKNKIHNGLKRFKRKMNLNHNICMLCTCLPVCSAIVSHKLTSSHHYVLANHILKGLHDQILWKNTETFSAGIIKKEFFLKV